MVASGFRPRIKYGVTFFRRNDGKLKGPVLKPLSLEGEGWGEGENLRHILF